MATPASSEPRAVSPDTWVNALRGGRPTLLQTLEAIARHPHHALHERVGVSDGLDDATDVEVDAIPDLATRPGVLEPTPNDVVHAEVDGLELRLSQLPSRQLELTADTRANRFVKRFIEEAAAALAGAPDHAALRRRLRSLLVDGPLAGVPLAAALGYQSSAVLERDPRYRQVLAAALALRP